MFTVKKIPLKKTNLWWIKIKIKFDKCCTGVFHGHFLRLALGNKATTRLNGSEMRYRTPRQHCRSVYSNSGQPVRLTCSRLGHLMELRLAKGWGKLCDDRVIASFCCEIIWCFSSLILHALVCPKTENNIKEISTKNIFIWFMTNIV